MNLKKHLEQKKKDCKYSPYKELSSILWPESNLDTRNVSMSRLINGKAEYIKIEWIKLICDYLEITPDELFNYNQ